MHNYMQTHRCCVLIPMYRPRALVHACIRLSANVRVFPTTIPATSSSSKRPHYVQRPNRPGLPGVALVRPKRRKVRSILDRPCDATRRGNGDTAPQCVSYRIARAVKADACLCQLLFSKGPRSRSMKGGGLLRSTTSAQCFVFCVRGRVRGGGRLHLQPPELKDDVAQDDADTPLFCCIRALVRKLCKRFAPQEILNGRKNWLQNMALIYV